MTDFIFLRPLWLIGAAVCLVALYLLYRKANTKSTWWEVMDEHIARSLIVSIGSHKFLTPLNLLLVTLTAIFIAMAGPSFDRQVPDDLKGKASVVVLLANSDSMYAGDVTPNRNRLAKQKVRELTGQLSGSQFGLITFAKSAHQVSPLTSDPQFLSLYLGELEPKLMPDLDQKVSGLDDGLDQAKAMLEGNARYPGNLLVITDQLTEKEVKSIVQFQNEQSITVEVLAIGTETGGSLRFVQSRDVSSDTATQMQLANFTSLKEQGVNMLGVTQNSDDIEWLTKQIKQSVKEANDLNPEFNFRDSGYLLAWLFIPACLLMFRKQSWLFSFLPLLFVTSIGYSPNTMAAGWDEIWWSADQLGQKALGQGDYQTAASSFDDPYRKGWSLYQLGDYQAAEGQLRKVETGEGYFYLANALAMQSKYKEALRFYGESIKAKGNFPAAQHNLGIVKDKIASSNKVSANQRNVNDDGQVMLQVGAKGNVKKKQHLNIDPLEYSEEELDAWLNKVKSSPEKLLKTKFELQAQGKMLDEL